jgi:hypothetical protein
MLELHVLLGLVGLGSGCVVLYGLVAGRPFRGWTLLFLATTTFTSITGFFLPPFEFDPARKVAVVSLILLGLAIASLYVFRLAGAWRWLYVAGATGALYLNVFVGVAEDFQKVPALQALAPTQSEPSFLIAQVVVLATLLGIAANRPTSSEPFARSVAGSSLRQISGRSRGACHRVFSWLTNRRRQMGERRPHADPRGSSWSPFRYVTFTVLWTATVVANIGTWMYNAGSGWLMTSLNADPFVVSLVQVATTLPMFLFALPAGALADSISSPRRACCLHVPGRSQRQSSPKAPLLQLRSR